VTFTLIDFFCGAGGSSQGAVALPGVTARLAANHWGRAIESHAANFPHTEHYQGDLHAADLEGFPAADLFWASPECPQWSVARGRRREFDKQPDLFGEVLSDAAADRSRALMWDVPRYLEAMQLRGRPVLAGVVERHRGAGLGALAHMGRRDPRPRLPDPADRAELDARPPRGHAAGAAVAGPAVPGLSGQLRPLYAPFWAISGRLICDVSRGPRACRGLVDPRWWALV
jgi:hypothetical protein